MSLKEFIEKTLHYRRGYKLRSYQSYFTWNSGFRPVYGVPLQHRIAFKHYRIIIADIIIRESCLVTRMSFAGWSGSDRDFLNIVHEVFNVPGIGRFRCTQAQGLHYEISAGEVFHSYVPLLR